MSVPQNCIIFGDCLQVLPSLPSQSINLVLTDPPYLVGYKSRDGRALLNDDNAAWLEPSFAELFRVLANDSYCISFYGFPEADRFVGAFKRAGFRPVGHFVFVKDYSTKPYHAAFQHECAYLLAKGKPRPQRVIADVQEWQYTGNKLHPTEKSVPMLTELVSAFSQDRDLILDPFAGSGSTLAAAKQLKRRYLGIELDATYHAAACRRLIMST